MGGATTICLSLSCLAVPILLGFLGLTAYTLGVGAVRVPGVSRYEHREGQAWIAVPTFARRAGELLGVFLSGLGTLFGLLGYLLPWVALNLRVSEELMKELAELVPQLEGLGEVTGTWSGAAIALQSLIVGLKLLGAQFSGATSIATVLILLSLMLWLLLLLLILSLITSLVTVVRPLWKIRLSVQAASRSLLLLLGAAFSLGCVFLIALQASVGGIGVKMAGVSVSLTPAGGFWITMGGLVLALTGVFVAGVLAGTLEEWAQTLTTLPLEGEASR